MQEHCRTLGISPRFIYSICDRRGGAVVRAFASHVEGWVNRSRDVKTGSDISTVKLSATGVSVSSDLTIIKGSPVSQ